MEGTAGDEGEGEMGGVDVMNIFGMLSTISTFHEVSNFHAPPAANTSRTFFTTGWPCTSFGTNEYMVHTYGSQSLFLHGQDAYFEVDLTLHKNGAVTVPGDSIDVMPITTKKYGTRYTGNRRVVMPEGLINKLTVHLNEGAIQLLGNSQQPKWLTFLLSGCSKESVTRHWNKFGVCLEDPSHPGDLVYAGSGGPPAGSRGIVSGTLTDLVAQNDGRMAPAVTDEDYKDSHLRPYRPYDARGWKNSAETFRIRSQFVNMHTTKVQRVYIPLSHPLFWQNPEKFLKGYIFNMNFAVNGAKDWILNYTHDKDPDHLPELELDIKRITLKFPHSSATPTHVATGNIANERAILLNVLDNNGMDTKLFWTDVFSRNIALQGPTLPPYTFSVTVNPTNFPRRLVIAFFHKNTALEYNRGNTAELRAEHTTAYSTVPIPQGEHHPYMPECISRVTGLRVTMGEEDWFHEKIDFNTGEGLHQLYKAFSDMFSQFTPMFAQRTPSVDYAQWKRGWRWIVIDLDNNPIMGKMKIARGTYRSIVITMTIERIADEPGESNVPLHVDGISCDVGLVYNYGAISVNPHLGNSTGLASMNTVLDYPSANAGTEQAGANPPYSLVGRGTVQATRPGDLGFRAAH